MFEIKVPFSDIIRTCGLYSTVMGTARIFLKQTAAGQILPIVSTGHSTFLRDFESNSYQAEGVAENLLDRRFFWDAVSKSVPEANTSLIKEKFEQVGFTEKQFTVATQCFTQKIADLGMFSHPGYLVSCSSYHIFCNGSTGQISYQCTVQLTDIQSAIPVSIALPGSYSVVCRLTDNELFIEALHFSNPLLYALWRGVPVNMSSEMLLLAQTYEYMNGLMKTTAGAEFQLSLEAAVWVDYAVLSLGLACGEDREKISSYIEEMIDYTEKDIDALVQWATETLPKKLSLGDRKPTVQMVKELLSLQLTQPGLQEWVCQNWGDVTEIDFSTVANLKDWYQKGSAIQKIILQAPLYSAVLTGLLQYSKTLESLDRMDFDDNLGKCETGESLVKLYFETVPAEQWLPHLNLPCLMPTLGLQQKAASVEAILEALPLERIAHYVKIFMNIALAATEQAVKASRQDQAFEPMTLVPTSPVTGAASARAIVEVTPALSSEVEDDTTPVPAPDQDSLLQYPTVLESFTAEQKRMEVGRLLRHLHQQQALPDEFMSALLTKMIEQSTTLSYGTEETLKRLRMVLSSLPQDSEAQALITLQLELISEIPEAERTRVLADALAAAVRREESEPSQNPFETWKYRQRRVLERLLETAWLPVLSAATLDSIDTLTALVIERAQQLKTLLGNDFVEVIQHRAATVLWCHRTIDDTPCLRDYWQRSKSSLLALPIENVVAQQILQQVQQYQLPQCSEALECYWTDIERELPLAMAAVVTMKDNWNSEKQKSIIRQIVGDWLGVLCARVSDHLEARIHLIERLVRAALTGYANKQDALDAFQRSQYFYTPPEQLESLGVYAQYLLHSQDTAFYAMPYEDIIERLLNLSADQLAAGVAQLGINEGVAVSHGNPVSGVLQAMAKYQASVAQCIKDSYLIHFIDSDIETALWDGWLLRAHIPISSLRAVHSTLTYLEPFLNHDYARIPSVLLGFNLAQIINNLNTQQGSNWDVIRPICIYVEKIIQEYRQSYFIFQISAEQANTLLMPYFREVDLELANTLVLQNARCFNRLNQAVLGAFANRSQQYKESMPIIAVIQSALESYIFPPLVQQGCKGITTVEHIVARCKEHAFGISGYALTDCETEYQYMALRIYAELLVQTARELCHQALIGLKCAQRDTRTGVLNISNRSQALEWLRNNALRFVLNPMLMQDGTIVFAPWQVVEHNITELLADVITLATRVIAQFPKKKEELLAILGAVGIVPQAEHWTASGSVKVEDLDPQIAADKWLWFSEWFKDSVNTENTTSLLAPMIQKLISNLILWDCLPLSYAHHKMIAKIASLYEAEVVQELSSCFEGLIAQSVRKTSPNLSPEESAKCILERIQDFQKLSIENKVKRIRSWFPCRDYYKNSTEATSFLPISPLLRALVLFGDDVHYGETASERQESVDGYRQHPVIQEICQWLTTPPVGRSIRDVLGETFVVLEEVAAVSFADAIRRALAEYSVITRNQFYQEPEYQSLNQLMQAPHHQTFARMVMYLIGEAGTEVPKKDKQGEYPALKVYLLAQLMHKSPEEYNGKKAFHTGVKQWILTELGFENLGEIPMGCSLMALKGGVEDYFRTTIQRCEGHSKKTNHDLFMVFLQGWEMLHSVGRESSVQINHCINQLHALSSQIRESGSESSTTTARSYRAGSFVSQQSIPSAFPTTPPTHRRSGATAPNTPGSGVASAAGSLMGSTRSLPMLFWGEGLVGSAATPPRNFPGPVAHSTPIRPDGVLLPPAFGDVSTPFAERRLEQPPLNRQSTAASNRGSDTSSASSAVCPPEHE